MSVLIPSLTLKTVALVVKLVLVEKSVPTALVSVHKDSTIALVSAAISTRTVHTVEVVGKRASRVNCV